MFKFLLLVSLGISSSSFALDIQMSDLKMVNNDKEGQIKAISRSDLSQIENTVVTDYALKKLGEIFYRSLYDFLSTSKIRCEFNFNTKFKAELGDADFFTTNADVEKYLKILRVNHYIDDILYENLSAINRDEENLLAIAQQFQNDPSSSSSRRLSRKETRLDQSNNVEDLYLNFQQWPDEAELCTYRQFNFLRDGVRDEDGKKSGLNRKARLKLLKRLNLVALKKGIITSETYRKLEYFRNDNYHENRYITLQSYFDITFKAKNKLLPYGQDLTFSNLDGDNQSEFSSERAHRHTRLTKRKELYEKYNENEIMMLAQVLVKASRRMGVDPDVTSSAPIISQTFEFTNQNGERENYVEVLTLDPQSQYNLARKRLRKDIFDLQTMDTFYKKKIRYEEIVMAAYETGYITYEDIEYAVKYDDLWNPEKTRFEKIKSFIFDVGGYATFFAPPPFNVVASLGLTLVEGFIDSKNVKGENNENISTFID